MHSAAGQGKSRVEPFLSFRVYRPRQPQSVTSMTEPLAHEDAQQLWGWLLSLCSDLLSLQVTILVRC